MMTNEKARIVADIVVSNSNVEKFNMDASGGNVALLGACIEITTNTVEEIAKGNNELQCQFLHAIIKHLTEVYHEKLIEEEVSE
ncbi:hypothetical protein HB825_05455 [Listeria booriae]|uniref:hypothetical protein n=1 Tax=Listeria booriae TaxID=1552123 RepID=UPI00164E1ACD|nr:hypothetical protein [Listeria booriae]MBC6134283.1 hypothetical protein [Listeria booriae]